jgi:tyrosine-protein phosphatase YwqE
MSWWNRLRPSSGKLTAPEFNAPAIKLGEYLIADVHSHIVPGVDDGAENLDQSIGLIEKLIDLGYQRAVLTSHIHSDIYPNSKRTLTPPFLRLQEAIEKRWPHFHIHLAAEYFLDRHFEECVASDDLLSFPALDENGRAVQCVLFEFGFHEPPMNHHQVLFDLQMAGYTPVLAHAERYPYWHNALQEFDNLSDRGVWITINGASLAGSYGPETYHAAKTLMEKGLVRMICSDAHATRHVDSLETIGRLQGVQTWLKSGAAMNPNAGMSAQK